MPSDPAKYPPNWAAVSLAVRARAGNACEQCKVGNGETVVRSKDGTRYSRCDGEYINVFDATDGRHLKDEDESIGGCEGIGERWRDDGTKIVLTVAHLNADGDVCKCDPLCADENHLRALCQRCHLQYDRPRSLRSRRVKTGQLEMLK